MLSEAVLTGFVLPLLAAAATSPFILMAKLPHRQRDIYNLFGIGSIAVCFLIGTFLFGYGSGLENYHEYASVQVKQAGAAITLPPPPSWPIAYGKALPWVAVAYLCALSVFLWLIRPDDRP